MLATNDLRLGKSGDFHQNVDVEYKTATFAKPLLVAGITSVRIVSDAILSLLIAQFLVRFVLMLFLIQRWSF
jgi:hypothetical protein